MDNPTLRLAALLAGGLSLTSLAPAQIGNTCSDPITIPASGSFAQPFGGTTVSGYPGPGTSCGDAMASVQRDLFFVWTAPAAGDYVLRGDAFSFFGSSLRSFAVYQGGSCGGACLYSASATLDGIDPVDPYIVNASAGETFLLQIGVVGPGTTSSLATAQVEILPLEGDTCSTPLVASGETSFQFEWAAQRPSGFTGQGACGAVPAGATDVFVEWTAETSGAHVIDTDGNTFLLSGPCHVSVHDAANPCSTACIAAVDPSSSELTMTGVNAGETYLLRFAGGVSEVSIVSIRADDCGAPDVFDPNETIATASAVAAGVYPGLALCPGVDPFDYYRIQLDPGEVAFVDATVMGGEAILLEGVDPTGVIANPWPLGAGQPGTAAIGNGGTTAQDYYFRAVQVTGGASSVPSSYELTVDVQEDGCLNYAQDAYEPNDNCGDARLIVPGYDASLTMEADGQDTFRLGVAPGALLRVSIIANFDFDIEITNGCVGVPLASSSNGPSEWMNSGSQTVEATIRIAARPAYPGEVTCQNYALVVRVGDAVHSTTACQGVTMNSSGFVGQLEGYGTAVAGTGSLTLLASRLPLGYASFVLGSRNSGTTPNLGGGPGTLCLGGQVIRFNGTLTNPGATAVSYPLNIRSFPEPPSLDVPVMSGETWYFQVWHRDAATAGGSNLTQSVSVTFS